MNLSRRELIWSLGAASALDAAQYRPTLLVGIYVFTQQFAAHKQTLEQGMREAFPAIRRTGFRGVELMSQFFTPENRETTLALLKENGLESWNAYCGGAIYDAAKADPEIATVLAFAGEAKKAGARVIDINPNPKPNQELKTEAELALQARSLDRIGAELRKSGMKLMTHHHLPELKEKGREWRYNLKHTRPELLNICVDTDWALRGGEDPVGMMREAGRRLLSLHVRTSHQGVWSEAFDDGEPDHRPIAAYLKQVRYNGYISVELAYEKATKMTRSFEENVRRSREYAEEIFGVKA